MHCMGGHPYTGYICLILDYYWPNIGNFINKFPIFEQYCAILNQCKTPLIEISRKFIHSGLSLENGQSRTDKNLLFQIILHKINFTWKSYFADEEGKVTADKGEFYPEKCQSIRRNALVQVPVR